MYAFAHDLRGHLRTVITRIQLVQRRGGGTLPQEDQGLLCEAGKSAGDIDGLMNSMLSLVDPEVVTDETSLPLLIQGSLIELESNLVEAGAEVAVDNSLDIPVPAGLRSVLKELVTNACKFRDTARPLKIHIAADMTPEGLVRLAVTDNGTGVTPPYLEKIFMPFARLHAQGDYPGHGLGLAICRRVMSGMNGDIHAQAPAEGGLSLHISFPT
jgi:signal transduction histidine kinase